jgi:hypothetical protein
VADSSAVPVKRLILVPGIITLAITLLRLVGELLNWSPKLFDRHAGGGGAIVGIAWLVPIFGIYFALQLAKVGQRPAGAARALGYPLLGLFVAAAGVFAGAKLGIRPGGAAFLPFLVAESLIVGFVAVRGWPALGRVLLAYAMAARIPVAMLMLVAILGSWGTHYDAPPPNFPPAIGPWARWFLTGVVPQLTVWITFTLLVGALFGGLAAVVAGRRPQVARA